MVGEVQVQQHKDRGLSVHAEQGDQTHPNRDAHVVAEQIEQPDRTDCGKRNGQKNDEGFYDRAGIEVQQQEHDEECDRYYNL